MARLPVSIVIPVYNGGAAFDRCLTALAALDPPPLDIVVVDDHSTDGSAERALAAGFRVLRTSGRGGPASARNLGASKTSGDVLLFVDADVIVPVDLVARMDRALGSDPAISAVIGCYDELAPDPGFFTQYKNLYQRYVHQRARREAFTFWGACGAVRRPIFDELGGFDPEYARASIEDIEFGYRLRDAGHRIALDRTIEVTHAKRWTARLLMRSDILHRAVPWTRLILRSRRMDNDLNLGWAHRAAVALAMTLAASLALAPWWPATLLVAIAAAGLLLVVDARLIAYFAARRGGWFTIRAIGWQWFHYLYSGLAFGLALGLYAVRRQPARRRTTRRNESVELI